MITHQKVDEFLDNANQWQVEMKHLRAIVLSCGLTEEFKWRNPCYRFQRGNILLIGKFKAYCSLSFFKGILLKDMDSILESPGENSQSVRLIKLTSDQEITHLEDTLKAYIYEAIEVERNGLKVELKEKDRLILSDELLQKFEETPELKAAFEVLTPGRQRGYHLYFSSAKQSKTRLSRIDQYTERILAGFGFHDCVCGQSKRMPTCDGSHKQLDD